MPDQSLNQHAALAPTSAPGDHPGVPEGLQLPVPSPWMDGDQHSLVSISAILLAGRLFVPG